MRYYLLPLILSLACSHVKADFGRNIEILGGIMCGTGCAALATAAAACGYGTAWLAGVTGGCVRDLGSESTVPMVCAGIAATSAAAGATALVAGMAYEAGSYGASMLSSSDRPPVFLLRFVGAICKAIAENSGDHHYHHHEVHNYNHY